MPSENSTILIDCDSNFNFNISMESDIQDDAPLSNNEYITIIVQLKLVYGIFKVYSI